MFKLIDKVDSDSYKILDTDTNIIEIVSSGLLINAVVTLGMQVDGIVLNEDETVSFKNLGVSFKKQFVGHKFRLYPNKEQEILLNKTFGCCRFIWNAMLSDRIEFYKNTGESLQTPYKYYVQEHEFLKEVPSRALQLTERNLNRAYMNFFRRISKGDSKVGFPKFKRKFSGQSFSLYNDNNSIKILDGKYITLAKIGKVKFKQHRKIYGKIGEVTVSKSPTGKYYISMSTEEYVSHKEVHKNKLVGVDLGIKELAILDDGTKLPNSDVLDKYLMRLAFYQQKYSRTQKGSKNRERLRKKIARIHERIRNIRMDNIHKFTHKMVDENQVIITEDLSIKNMMSNLTHSRKKRTRSRHIANASWYEFTRQFDYKSAWRNNTYQKVGKLFPSTQLCSCCGYKNVQLKNNTSIRDWVCPSCNTHHDRDINAAINIRNEGKRILGIA